MKKQLFKVVGLFMIPAMLFTSCASIIAPEGKKNIPVQVKNVQDYDISVNGVMMGDAAFITVSKGDVVTIEADGYKQSVTMIQGKFNAWVLGNLIFGGVIGIIIDGVSGNFNKVTTHAISVKLKADKK